MFLANLNNSLIQNKYRYSFFSYKHDQISLHTQFQTDTESLLSSLKIDKTFEYIPKTEVQEI